MAALASFARICVSDLDAGLKALTASGVTDVRLRFGHPASLQLALVGEVLVLAGSDEVIEPFRSTDVTVIVDDLDGAVAAALSASAEIIREPAEQQVGRNATVAFPGGPIIEYVQWNEETRTVAGL
ncbi:hypothetical protein GCM10011575_45840 [Microlunatus endophyticus]|uniref:Uncharacterized protein n=1 Tax=Microlunatus endophyticus TaxID=1716077 RepID=A0A917W9E0_9ACTN|nr:hypothetical protein [Microlunatus endophyticus]GGL82444.1 hypothetical protein GCM10011575_45840 [Microlunatus endophyticus]